MAPSKVVSFPSDGEQAIFFWCPGCETNHWVPVSGPRAWQWNQSVETPTLSPSILVSWESGEERKRNVCHSFVREGRIEFLGDCTHALAGQTIQLEAQES
jgi:hypothetical protein